MYSIASRTYQVLHFRSCLNKIDTRHAIAAVVSRKRYSTEPVTNITSIDSEWQNVYKGTLASRIRNLKIVSFMTSGVGLCIQPMLLAKAAEVGSSMAATIGVCTIAGFFTFITPVLIHLITRKYVTSLEYNDKSDEYIATVYSFFLRPKKVQFKTFQVRLPPTQKLTVTFYANNCPLFVDPQSFDDVTHYQRILGYDRPYEFDSKYDTAIKKPVKSANKS